MEEVLQTNIFFYITSAAVIAVAVAVLVAFGYIISILRDVKDVSRKVRKESTGVVEDLEHLRDELKEEGARAKTVFEVITAPFITKTRRRKKGVNAKAQ